MCRGSISLDLICVPEAARGTGMAYVQIRGVHAYFAELKERSLGVSEPENRPYGMRDFKVVDPDGNRLCFGESTVG